MRHNRGMRFGPLFLLAGMLAQAQYPQTIPGSQLPGVPNSGRYPGRNPPQDQPLPGGSLPGRNRSSKKVATPIPTDTVAGILRRVSATEITLQPADKRIIRIAISKTTKYVTTDATGKSVDYKSSDLEPGDHITIEASRDDQSFFFAVSVRFDKKGTAAERAAAGEALPELISSGGGTAISDSPADADDDRPRLTRPGAPAAVHEPPAVAAVVVEPEPPSRPATVMAPAAAPRSDDDPGPPRLNRNRTLAQRSEPPSVPPPSGDRRVTAPQTVDADPVVTRNVERPQQTQGEDPIIAAAREAAVSFTETLPNYVVKQVTTRYQTEQAAGQKTSWRALDVVTADLVMQGGKETYKNILVNGKAPKQALEKSGSWSNGEFASMLQLVLNPGSETDFRGKRSSSIVNRQVWRYDYSVEQQNSHWTLEAAGQSYEPAYAGAIWIDKETSRVLRIEMSAKRIPADFPLDSGESTVDYDFVLLGDRKFLVPVHSEVLSCQRGTRDCSRNVIDFRNYRKFGADTSISFEKDPR